MTATLFRVALLACLAIPSGAQAARSDWAAADQAQLRLLLSGADGDRIAGGIEIVLEPGWYTYWSNPGEAGVPPVFDFSGSDNVAAVEVLYPAPERHDDGTSVSLIYRDDVVLPLAVTPATAGLPVTLRVEARFGVCSSVCIPTAAGASVTLPPAAPRDPLAEARLESFRTRVPMAPVPGRFDIETVAVDGDALLIDVRAPEFLLPRPLRGPAGRLVHRPAVARLARGRRVALPAGARRASAGRGDRRPELPLRRGRRRRGDRESRSHSLSAGAAAAFPQSL